MLRGEIAKRLEEARKGLSPNLGKNTSNLPTKESNKKKKTYITHPLQTLHETKTTSHQHTIINPVAHTPNTLTQKPRTSKTSQAPRIKKLT